MRVKTTGKSAVMADRDRDYAEKKLGRLSRFFKGVRDAHVTLGHQRGQHIVEVQLDLDGFVLRAEERDTDLHAAMDAVAEKLESQIRRFKGKIRRHKGRADAPRVAEVMSQLAEEVEEHHGEAGEAPEIVRTKSVTLQPMSSDEAMLQLELLSHSFYAFLNADTQQMNIVYQRRDGSYGLLEFRT